MGKITINGITRDMTADEQSAYDAKVANWNSKSAERKLSEIKEIRLEKLIETDYLANSDVTMPDNIKTWRQSLRDLPQTYTTESKYDELLARETDKTKDNFGQLTHSVWSKP
tara:strand:+ start:747 stop:1082 length:336 start_codon:yes stop_codon:yes gene_type:complete